MAHTDLYRQLTNALKLSQPNFYSAVLHVSHMVVVGEDFFFIVRKHLALNFIKLFALYCSVHISVAVPRGVHLKLLESDEKDTF